MDGVGKGGAPPKALQPRAEQGGGNRLYEEKRRRRGCYTQSRVLLVLMHLFPSFTCVLVGMWTVEGQRKVGKRDMQIRS